MRIALLTLWLISMPARAINLTMSDRKSITHQAAKLLRDLYFLPDLGREMSEALERNLASGRYDVKTGSDAQFADRLTEDLQAICKDKHLSVVFSKEKLPVQNHDPKPTAVEILAMRDKLASENFKFQRLIYLSGNVGYLRMDGFAPAEMASETAAAAMAFLAKTDALIIDLRWNRGGDPALVAFLASYFFDEKPVHLNDLIGRKPEDVRPSWTLAKVPGSRYLGKDIFLLTSERTFSAAEEFAYDLKALKRATLIGATTGGGANPMMSHRLDDHFEIRIPFARAFNPITKTNWEGAGVKPDIEVPTESALKEAYIRALENLSHRFKEKRELLKVTIANAPSELARIGAD